MWKKIAATALALAGLALTTQAVADDDSWWKDDGYRVSDGRYDSGRDARYRHSARGDDYVYADVVAAEPIYRHVRVRRPERECWDEEVYDRPQYRGTARATVAGGVIGGAVGRQFGDGKGRDAMTVLGALLGSAIANDVAERDRYGDYDRVRTVERCETHWQTYEDRRIEGYRVTYVYGGRRYTTRMAHEPGRRVRVRVAVTPVAYERY